MNYIKEKNNINDICRSYKTPDETLLLRNQNNDLSHIFGSYYLSRKYPREEVEKAQRDKERYDEYSNWIYTLFTPRTRKMSRLNKKADSVRDLINDKFGIDLYNKNPNMSDKEVMDYVYENYLKKMRNIYEQQEK